MQTQAINAEVIVDDTLRAHVISEARELSPGNRSTWDVNLKRNDILELKFDLHRNSVSGYGAWICPRNEYLNLLNGRTPSGCAGKYSDYSSIEFRYSPPYQGQYIIFIDNSHSLFSSKYVTTNIWVSSEIPQELKQEIKSGFEEMYNILEEGFIFTPFDIRIKSCGQENAFSAVADGDITICTELFENLHDRPGAIMGIFFHELAHTLLNLWGQPNYANEQTADELAAVLLIASGEEGEAALEEFISYWGGKDTIAEATWAQHQYAPHPLSIQRLRNLSLIADNPADYISRWRPLLYERTKTEYLYQEISNPSKWSDPQLAESIINERNRLNAN
jgi:hypothetical protein